jgi:hypothetical protein
MNYFWDPNLIAHPLDLSFEKDIMLHERIHLETMIYLQQVSNIDLNKYLPKFYSGNRTILKLTRISSTF